MDNDSLSTLRGGENVGLENAIVRIPCSLGDGLWGKRGFVGAFHRHDDFLGFRLYGEDCSSV